MQALALTEFSIFVLDFETHAKKSCYVQKFWKSKKKLGSFIFHYFLHFLGVHLENYEKKMKKLFSR